jgi:hypothetical protein
VLFLAAGLGLSEFLTTLRRRPLASRLAYSYLMGVAFVAEIMYLSSYVFGLRLGQATILVAVVLPGGSGLVRWLSTRYRVASAWNIGHRSRRQLAREPLFLMVVAIGVVVSLGVLADALTNPVTDFDGRMTWCLQAKYVRAEESVTPRVFRESEWDVTNRGYPLLLPLAQVAVEQAFKTPDDDRVIRLLYAAFFPAFLLIVYEASARLAGRSAAATAILMASTVPFLAFATNGGAAGTYSDFPLAGFYSAAVLLLLDDRRSLSSPMAAGLLLAACVLTKREGLLLAAVAAAAGLCVALPRLSRRRGPRRVRTVLAWTSLLSVPVMSALALRMSWSARIPATTEDYGTPLLKASTYFEWFPRLLTATPDMLRETFNPRKWSIFWAVVAIALVAGGRALRYRFFRLLLVAAAAPLAIGCLAYGIYPDPHWLATHTWSRFLAQASPLTLVIVAFLMKQVFRGNGEIRKEPMGPTFPAVAE